MDAISPASLIIGAYPRHSRRSAQYIRNPFIWFLRQRTVEVIASIKVGCLSARIISPTRLDTHFLVKYSCAQIPAGRI